VYEYFIKHCDALNYNVTNNKSDALDVHAAQKKGLRCMRMRLLGVVIILVLVFTILTMVSFAQRDGGTKRSVASMFLAAVTGVVTINCAMLLVMQKNNYKNRITESGGKCML